MPIIFPLNYTVLEKLMTNPLFLLQPLRKVFMVWSAWLLLFAYATGNF